MNKDIYVEGSDIELEKKTVEVYVSKKGGLFLTEESALKDSYTHIKCSKHDKIYAKNSYCYECSEDRQLEKFYKMEEVEYDGTSWMYSEEYDEWCPDMDTAEEIAEYHEVELKDLRLVLAVPNNLHEVEEDYWEDIWYDGAQLPSEVEDALENLNKAIREHGKNFSWEAGNKRIKV